MTRENEAPDSSLANDVGEHVGASRALGTLELDRSIGRINAAECSAWWVRNA